MRYPAAEKLEITRLVEQSHLPAKQTLDMLSVPRTTFYRWYWAYSSRHCHLMAVNLSVPFAAMFVCLWWALGGVIVRHEGVRIAVPLRLPGASAPGAVA